MSYGNAVLIPGDRVVMKMDPEARSWSGTKFPPDGTKGTFLGRRRHTVYEERWGNSRNFFEPGIYERDGGVIIEWDNGSTEVDGHSHQLIDQKEYKRRLEALHAQNLPYGAEDNPVKIDDLPVTNFYEQDIVRFAPGHGLRSHLRNLLRVHSIMWNWESDARGWCYMVEWINEDGAYARAGHVYVRDEELELVERGNLWREVNGQELVFKNLEEEVHYAANTGGTIEMKNPSTDNYSWNKEQSIQAVRNGYAHGIRVHSGLFGGGPVTGVFRCKNEELGGRVQAATIAGFDG